MQRILVPVDFSDVTQAVINHARSLAKAFDGNLWLMHVVAPNPEFVGYEAGPQAVRDHLAAHYREEHRQLQNLAKATDDNGTPTEALLVQGPAAEVILDHTARLSIDTIVLGSHGHGALYHLLMGSVTEAVLHKTTCPVVVVPARS